MALATRITDARKTTSGGWYDLVSELGARVRTTAVDVEDPQASGHGQEFIHVAGLAPVMTAAEAVFESDDRLMATERLVRPLEDLVFRTLDVDLDEGGRETGRERVVESRDGHRDLVGISHGGRRW